MIHVHILLFQVKQVKPHPSLVILRGYSSIHSGNPKSTKHRNKVKRQPVELLGSRYVNKGHFESAEFIKAREENENYRGRKSVKVAKSFQPPKGRSLTRAGTEGLCGTAAGSLDEELEGMFRASHQCVNVLAEKLPVEDVTAKCPTDEECPTVAQ